MSKKSKYRIGVCPECKVKENDPSRKGLYQCPYCERWFCVKHFDPRLAFIKDLKAMIKYPEVRATFEQEEWRREDGHPDFVYTRKRFEELEMEEKLFSKLIEASLNRSKAYGREKLERKKVDIKPEPSPTEYLEKPQSYSSKSTTEQPISMSKKRHLPQIMRNKLVIASLVILGFLLIEYFFFTIYFHPTIYILVALGTIYLDYKLFVRASRIRIHSDLRLFGMRILSGITLLIGIIFIIGIFFLPIFYPTQLSYENPVYICLIIFFGIFGLGLILLSSFLLFRFMRRAGIIVYQR